MKAVAYCRVSTDDQQEKGTIQNQVEFAQKYTDLHSIPLIDIYMDQGVSGTIPLEERPFGKKLIEDAKKGIFDTLLIYKLDRLGRSARATLNSIHLLEEYNIKIKSMSEPFDTENPAGRFMITMLAGVADLERSTILERMQYGTEKAARDGKWLGGIVPYGYNVNAAKFLEINEVKMPCGYSEADVVRLIYDMLAVQKLSTIKIADFLNDNNIPTHYIKDSRKITKGKRKVHTDGLWRPSRIGNLVRNTVYMGVHFYGKRTTKQRTVVERSVPAIVSKETHSQALNVMINNRIWTPKNTKNKQYLLKSLLKCEACGRTYIGTSHKGKVIDGNATFNAYYVCGGKRSTYKCITENRCRSKPIKAEKAEEIVWGKCLDLINNPEIAKHEMDNKIIKNKTITNEYMSEIELSQNVLNDLENEKQNIMKLYRKNIIGIVDVESQMLEIEKERNKHIEKINYLEQKIAGTSQKNNFTELKSLLLKLKKELTNIDIDTKRNIILQLIKNVKVNSNPTENIVTLEMEYLFF